MDKRVSERLDVNMNIKYLLWNPLFWKHQYSGSIKNISESGMYLDTKTIYFPLDSLIEIYIPDKKETIRLPIKANNIVWRNILSDNSCKGIGIEFKNPPKEYMEFIDKLKKHSLTSN